MNNIRCFVFRCVFVCSCLKGARVGDFGGRTLSSGFGTTLLINDASIPEVAHLQTWWQNDGSGAQTKALSTSTPSHGFSLTFLHDLTVTFVPRTFV